MTTNFQVINTSSPDPLTPTLSGILNYHNLYRPSGAYFLKNDCNVTELNNGYPIHTNNGDEELYPNKIGTYTKGLLHNSLGEVNLTSYNLFVNALNLKTPEAFNSIVLGGVKKLTNPQGGLAFDIEGMDAFASYLPPAPVLNGNESAGEMIELYWMALTRDINFSDYSTNPLTIQAANNLSTLLVYDGPKVGGVVTPNTLFRGNTVGDLVGPYISQFLYKNVPFGPLTYSQKMKTYNPSTDFMTNYGEWLNVQNGANPSYPEPFDPVLRYIRNGRDLSEWVHMDVLYQAYFQGMLICLGNNYPVNPTNPYLTSLNQQGFVTFGGPHIATLMTEVATRGLKCVWFQKWFVNLRLRPEEYGGLIHLNLTGQTSYPLSPILNVNQQALALTFSNFGSYLLPQAFPEGCPTHPSYGAGHATVAGACVTVLKAFFDCNYIIPSPVVPDNDGLNLLPFVGPNLTVGNELNKLASNISIGRDIAGVHYRSDYWQSLLLGEQVAVRILQDQKGFYNENFSGWSFTGFQGNTINIIST